LNENKINSDFLKQRDEASGHTIIQVDDNDQNCIILYGGSNKTITTEDIDETLSHFEKGDYLVLQNETNNIECMINKAYEKGLKVCFNVSPYSDELLKLPLGKCSYLIVNEIEGSSMVSKPADTDPYELIDELTKKYPNSSFVLTLGSRGSILKQVGCDPISCKSFKVQAVDTTAAGDTFLGYLITNLATGMNPALAIKCATAASALAVQTKGATPSIPKANAVLDFIKKSKVDVLVDKL
ncbi:MAG: ribokinase, partial [Succinivibrio sp.]|nr:ribokinase [Succinivibrio sp.]